jgi:hypothetical protein
MKPNALQIAEIYKHFSREFKSRWRYILRKQRLDMENEVSGLKDQIYVLKQSECMLRNENQQLKMVMGMMMSDEDAELFVNGQQIQFIPHKRFLDTPQFRREMVSISTRIVEQWKAEGGE